MNSITQSADQNTATATTNTAATPNYQRLIAFYAAMIADPRQLRKIYKYIKLIALQADSAVQTKDQHTAQSTTANTVQTNDKRTTATTDQNTPMNTADQPAAVVQNIEFLIHDASPHELERIRQYILRLRDESARLTT